MRLCRRRAVRPGSRSLLSPTNSKRNLEKEQRSSSCHPEIRSTTGHADGLSSGSNQRHRWRDERRFGGCLHALSKNRKFHWHMSGPHFRDYHLLLDEHSEQLLA